LNPEIIVQANTTRCLERFRPIALEKILGESIPRRNRLVSLDQPRQAHLSPHARQQLIRYLRKALGKLVAPHHRRLQPSGQTQGNAERRQSSMKLGSG